MNLSGADMQTQELQDRLAAVTAERDERSLVADQLSTALHIRNTQLTTVTAERDALLALVERYGADQWRRGNAGKDPQEFAEWRKEAQP